MSGTASSTAGPAKRLWAGGFDVLVTIAIFILVAVAGEKNGIDLGRASVFGATYFLYQFFCLAYRNGQTLGKLAADICVIAIAGSPLTVSQAAIRSGVRAIPFFMLGAPPFMGLAGVISVLALPSLLMVEIFLLNRPPARQTVADRMARSLVVPLPPVQPHGAPAGPMYSANDAEFAFPPKRPPAPGEKTEWSSGRQYSDTLSGITLLYCCPESTDAGPGELHQTKKEFIVRSMELNTSVRAILSAACILAVMIAGCAMQPAAETRVDPAVYRKAIESPIRTAADREADANRKPLQFLEFVQVRPGDKALDMAAGAGYTAELVALVVGPSGTAYAQVSKDNPKLNERLAAQPDANLKAVVRSFEDPYPEDGPKLDVVTLIMNYHDIAYLPVDRAKMNKHIFDALKPGGHFIVIDHSAKKGDGITVAKTLHRIEESKVKDELKLAGFVLVGESDFLRSPNDPREQAFYDMKDKQSDKFALRFVRP